jgi:mRNA-degrading endonuclease RelE of RelBE toxin-antitoxin system
MSPHRIERHDDAKDDIRTLGRSTTMRIFDAVLHFAPADVGDVTGLHGEMAGASRLRVGDYRVLFSLQDGIVRIFGVRHRSQVYR